MEQKPEDPPTQFTGLACGSNFDVTSNELKCSQDHIMGSECAKNFVSSIMANPESKVPAKCSVCSAAIEFSLVEKFLTADQLAHYDMIKAQNEMDKDSQIMLNCQFGKYYEVIPKEEKKNYFSCQNEECKRNHGTICLKEIKVRFLDNFKQSEIDRLNPNPEEDISTTLAQCHPECVKYAPIKIEWEEALERGRKRFCPSCGLGGIKDENGTHMSCEKCHTYWCYACGDAEADLDMEGEGQGGGDISGHNEDWENNQLRGPTELSDFFIDDERQKENESFEDLFHRILVYREIEKFFEDHSGKEFRTLCKIFPSVAKHGYSLDEAFTMDLTIRKT